MGAENDQSLNVLNIQPVIPVSINENINLINRVIFPVISTPTSFDENSTGLGDSSYTAWFSQTKKTRGFDCEVLCYDIKNKVGDENANQVGLNEFQKRVDIVSLHTPWTSLTHQLINADFIKQFSKPFWFINTARGNSVVTRDLIHALKKGSILGAGLDVLEYEKSSFESLFKEDMPLEMSELLKMERVILSPHIAGWTIESKKKLAQVIVNKIIDNFNGNQYE